MTAAAVAPRPAAVDAPPAGGTLRLHGPGALDRLDPAVAAGPPVADVVRLFSRQLVTYEPQADPRTWQAVAPVPDVAVAVPSTYNMGLGASHRSYVFHLRPGVLWDTSPPRPVTAPDFVRGFKRMANPVTRSPALTYFTSAIRGMEEFRAGFAAAVPRDGATAAQLAAYQDAHEIAGVFALDDETLVIELVRPSPEVVSVLALTCASAAPAEYDAFVPGSPELHRNLRSNGPYRVARFAPGAELRLERNPAWHRATDPVRRANVDRIEIACGEGGPAAVAARIDAGAADLPWSSPLRAPSAPRPAAAGTAWSSPHRAPSAPRPAAAGTALSHALAAYLAFNVADGAEALRDVRVRRAVALAVDRAALAERCAALLGEPAPYPADRLVPPHNDPGPSGEGTGLPPSPDPGAARSLLADAGYADGLSLTAVYRDRDGEPAVARAYAADLERAGIGVRLVALDDDAYRRAVLEAPPGGPRGWDLTARSRGADWIHRNGAVFLQPLFATGASANCGGYSDPEVDALVLRALEAAVEPRAKRDAAWCEVERRVLDDAAAVPLLFQAPAVPRRRGARVRGACPMPASGYADDLAALWLDPAGEDA
ncbi:MAG TPA: ABC transporter substrate-binding protein [Solirubrobacteraceae bacterium]|nr:ABC transporter substrate-binding protein [Solirubrobacteraceae bacterium]